MLSALTTIQMADQNLARSQAMTAADPLVKRETSYYEANIGSIKTAKDLVNNYRLFSYTMQAYGLSDMTYAKALMEKVMEGGVSNSKRQPKSGNLMPSSRATRRNPGSW